MGTCSPFQLSWQLVCWCCQSVLTVPSEKNSLNSSRVGECLLHSAAFLAEPHQHLCLSAMTAMVELLVLSWPCSLMACKALKDQSKTPLVHLQPCKYTTINILENVALEMSLNVSQHKTQLKHSQTSACTTCKSPSFSVRNVYIYSQFILSWIRSKLKMTVFLIRFNLWI